MQAERATAQQLQGESEFKDYYYIMGVEPGASAAAIDRAYWRLVRQYREERRDSLTLDELNEAYRVLGSPRLRQQFDALRDSVLGPGAPPQPPASAPDEPPPPLPVMRKQRPRPPKRPPRQDRSGWSARIGRALARLRFYTLLALASGASAGLVFWVLQTRP